MSLLTTLLAPIDSATGLSTKVNKSGDTMTGALINTSTILALRYKAEVNEEVLSASKSIVATDKQNQVLDPNGATRDVTLYASPTAGDYFLFHNKGTGGFNLDLKNNAGTRLTPISNGTSVAVLYSGTNWILV